MNEVELHGNAKLVKVNDVPKVVAEMLTNHRSIVGDLSQIVPHMLKGEVRNFLETKLKNSKKIITALEKGFVPVLVDVPVNIKTKISDLKLEVDLMMKSAPPEAIAALERAKSLKLFQHFAISGGRQGGDPVIVGVIGRKAFLVAAWILLDGSGAVGYTFKERTV